MSWHDLIDDASVERFVAGDLTSAVHGTSNLYDTELLEAAVDDYLSASTTTSNDEGITIVSSVPTATDYNNTNFGYSTVLVNAMDDSSLSLNPDSVASSILTETLHLSEIVEESLQDSTAATDPESDASATTYDKANSTDSSSSVSSSGSSVLVRDSRTTTSDLEMELAAKEWYLRSNTVDDWEREKKNIMRILCAVEQDCKDPERLLTNLLDEEEPFWKKRDDSQHGQEERPKTVAQPAAFWDLALIGAVLSLAAAMLIRAVQRGR